MNDIEVKYENNTYLVRYDGDDIHILIPAICPNSYAGDHYLGESEKEDIIALALNVLV
jgi:hypothetical protein